MFKVHQQHITSNSKSAASTPTHLTMWSGPTEEERKLLREYRLVAAPKRSSLSKFSRASCSPTVTTNSISTNTDHETTPSTPITTPPNARTIKSHESQPLPTPGASSIDAKSHSDASTLASTTAATTTTISKSNSTTASSNKASNNKNNNNNLIPITCINDKNNNSHYNQTNSSISKNNNNLKLSNNSKSISKNHSNNHYNDSHHHHHHHNNNHHHHHQHNNGVNKKSKISPDELSKILESVSHLSYLRLDCSDNDQQDSEKQQTKDVCSAPFIFESVDYLKRLNLRRKAFKKSTKRAKKKAETKR